MTKRILIVETAPFEINQVKNELAATGFPHVAQVIEASADWKLACDRFSPDIILASYTSVNGASNRAYADIGVPVVCFAGQIGEENAIRLIRAGIFDIIFENNIAALVPKIRMALDAVEQEAISSPKQLFTEHFSFENEGALDVIFENCMEGILLTIPEGGILSANPAACEMFGMTEQELIQKDRLSLVDISDPNFEILLEERRAKGKAKGCVTLVRKDGSMFPAIISSVLFKSSQGQTRTAMIIRDISAFMDSEQRLIQTQNKLKEAIRKLNKTMEASQDIICSFDDQARFITVSAACESIWGYSPDELIGRICFDFVFPEDLAITAKTDECIKSGNPVKIFENKYVHRSGRIVHMLWSAKWDEDEQLIYCVAKDITEKKNLEKICDVERKRFLGLYEMAPCSMVILKGPDHIFEMANPLYLQLINKGEDIIGKRVKDVLPELESQGIFDLLDSVYSTGKSFIANEKLVKFDFQQSNGLTDTYLNFLYQPHRNYEEEIDGILVFVVNVTEQVVSRLKIEQSEKLYRKLIMELPVATYSCDAEGRIEIYNKAAANLWGKEPEIGKDKWCGSWNILSSDGDPILLEDCPMAIALKEGRTITGTEIIIERENGEPRNILPHAVPYFNDAQQVTGAVNMLTDITEAKKAALDLQQQNKELLKANKELDRFVYSVSHDLRSPLTSILGIASFIEGESAEPDTIAHIGMIKQSINRLDGFIRKILSYSQNNRTSLEVEHIAITEKLTRIIGSLQYMVAGSEIDFQVDIDEACPFVSDRLRFNAIIENLLSNAIKYKNPAVENKFIKITGQVNKQDFHFSVSDNGIGVPEKYREKIFDMFFRVSGISEGSGIGLYIVKDMVEKLEGSIKVSSPQKGVTVFDVILKNFLSCQK